MGLVENLDDCGGRRSCGPDDRKVTKRRIEKPKVPCVTGTGLRSSKPSTMGNQVVLGATLVGTDAHRARNMPGSHSR